MEFQAVHLSHLKSTKLPISMLNGPFVSTPAHVGLLRKKTLKNIMWGLGMWYSGQWNFSIAQMDFEEEVQLDQKK